MTLIDPRKQIQVSEPSIRERMMHQSWCNKNGIKIYFRPIDWRFGNLVIEENGVPTVGEQIYDQTKLKPKDIKYHEVVEKLYTKIYYERNKEQ